MGRTWFQRYTPLQRSVYASERPRALFTLPRVIAVDWPRAGRDSTALGDAEVGTLTDWWSGVFASGVAALRAWTSQAMAGADSSTRNAATMTR